MISGYFWASKLERSDSVLVVSLEVAKRIAIIYFAWSIIYIFPTNIIDAVKYGYLGPVKVIYWNLVRFAK